MLFTDVAFEASTCLVTKDSPLALWLDPNYCSSRLDSSLLAVGTLKITISIAWSTSMLAWGMLTFGEGYNNSDLMATGLQTIRWNTDYLLKVFKEDSASSKLSGGTEYYIVYQVRSVMLAAPVAGVWLSTNVLQCVLQTLILAELWSLHMVHISLNEHNARTWQKVFLALQEKQGVTTIAGSGSLLPLDMLFT